MKLRGSDTKIQYYFLIRNDSTFLFETIDIILLILD